MSKKVMIVDDAQYMRTVLADILKKAGFEILAEAESGEDALEIYEPGKFDVVTMDIILLGISGVEAVKKIIKKDPQATILMVSAMGQQSLIVDAIKAGAKGFVVKPFTPESVVDEMNRVLGN